MPFRGKTLDSVGVLVGLASALMVESTIVGRVKDAKEYPFEQIVWTAVKELKSPPAPLIFRGTVSTQTS